MAGARHVLAKNPELSPSAVLGFAGAARVREAVRQGVKLRVLAKEYGVSTAAISLAARGKTYKKVESTDALSN